MTKFPRRFAKGLVPVLIGLGLAGAADGAGRADAAAEPLRCEIRETAVNGMVALEARVRSDVAASGSYSFRVTSAGGGGRSDISQGGAFTAGPGEPATLGQVMLGQRGATFDARLEVTSGGRSIACSERISL